MSKKTDRRVSGQYVLKGKVSLVAAAVAALLAAPLAQALAQTQPVVTGSEISWPDDGWYQVQTADGATNICEGTRSCQVEPGSYIVINHTTGERFTKVKVPASPATNSILVNGNTISWPDDGWYQVQSADTYESFCEGGSSCTVPAGVYIVINLTTGQRHVGVNVEGDDGAGSELVLDTLSNDLLAEMAGYRLDQAEALAPDVSAGVMAGNIGVTTLEAGQYEVDEIAQPTQRTQYACADGGTMTLETGRARIRDTDYSHDTSYNIWEFDSCRTELDAGVPVAGAYEIMGKLAVRKDFVSGRRFFTNNNSIVFTGFDIRTDGFALTVNASVQTIDSTAGVSIQRQRSVSIPQYVLQESSVPFSAPSLTIADVDFIQSYTDTANGALQRYSLDVEGWISGEQTDYTTVTVSTIAPLNRVLGFGPMETESVPFNGQLEMVTSDDSVLTITANPETDAGFGLLVDYSLLSADGEQRETNGAVFVDLPYAISDSLDWLDE